MKIIQFGEVIITKSAIKIEKWNIQREPEDPADATDEQLLLGYAVNWALAKLKKEIQSAAFDVFRKMFARN